MRAWFLIMTGQTERVSACVKGSAQIFTALPPAQPSTGAPPVPGLSPWTG